MESRVFRAWVDRTGSRFAVDFMRKIGVSRLVAEGYYRAMKAGQDVDVSRPIALAMQAVAHDLPPYGKDTAAADQFD